MEPLTAQTTIRELIALAGRAGLTLTERSGALNVTGPRTVEPALIEELRERRDDVLAALGDSPGMWCAGCGTTDFAFVSWAGEPWCHDCARRRGAALLAAEQPDRFPPPPPAPDGCIVDLEGNVWKLSCKCGMHDPPKRKGHEAKPVNAVELKEAS